MNRSEWDAWTDAENVDVDAWWEREQVRARLEFAQGLIEAVLTVVAVAS